MDVETIQQALVESGCDGWLLYDFHGLNPIAQDIVRPAGIVTRRWFLLLPRDGHPVGLMHEMEAVSFSNVPCHITTYRTHAEYRLRLSELLDGSRRIAMEYSPQNAIPYVSRVDAGTVESIRSFGVEVVSSGDLIATFLSRWSPEQINLHRNAAQHLFEIKDAAFARIAEAVAAGQNLTEYDVVSFIKDQFAKRALMTLDGPICAVDANAGNPHYEPAADRSASIGPDQLVLIDLWAKHNRAGAVYADITWMAYTGRTVPETMQQVFSIVARARDRAMTFINEHKSAGEEVAGWQVDRAVRTVIEEAGYGKHFVHRTGHSIGTEVHGVGPNIDDLETEDRRILQDGMAFSIEPGIYLPEFGIRSEIDCLMENGRAVVTTLPLQNEIITLFQ